MKARHVIRTQVYICTCRAVDERQQRSKAAEAMNAEALSGEGYGAGSESGGLHDAAPEARCKAVQREVVAAKEQGGWPAQSELSHAPRCH